MYFPEWNIERTVLSTLENISTKEKGERECEILTREKTNISTDSTPLILESRTKLLRISPPQYFDLDIRPDRARDINRESAG